MITGWKINLVPQWFFSSFRRPIQITPTFFYCQESHFILTFRNHGSYSPLIPFQSTITFNIKGPEHYLLTYQISGPICSDSCLKSLPFPNVSDLILLRYWTLTVDLANLSRLNFFYMICVKSILLSSFNEICLPNMTETSFFLSMKIILPYNGIALVRSFGCFEFLGSGLLKDCCLCDWVFPSNADMNLNDDY